MIQLAYLSTTPYLLTAGDIAQILTSSRRNNAPRGVTGMLLYRDGNVLQVLEGEAESVHERFEVIGRDPRHKGVLRLFERTIDEREFPEWNMGFRDLAGDGARELEGYSEFMEVDFDMGKISSSKAQKLLSIFKSNVR